jgi:putative ABC transport system permease protein
LLRDLALSTVRTLRAHALRFTLTSLGIVWGTLMLSFLSASMAGLDGFYQRQMINIGPKIVYVFPGVVLKDSVGARGARAVVLDNDDIGHIDGLNIVERAAPNLWLGSRVMRSERYTKLLWTFGVSAETLKIRDFHPERGRLITESDVLRNARVAFLAYQAKRRLFGRAPAVGKTVHIDSIPFRVIGVAREKGPQLMNTTFPDDDHVLIPYTAAQRYFTRSDRHNVLLFDPRTPEESWGAMDRVRALLALHHDFEPDDQNALGFASIQDGLQLLELVMFGLRIFLIAAGLITLLVGAVGVMNIMLVVVGERTKEIGLRKAVGASNAAIFTQFVAEALAMTTLAGTVGALLGWVAVVGARAALPKDGSQFLPVFDATTLGAIAFSLVAVGLVAATVPAVRASRIDPAVSLRSR